MNEIVTGYLEQFESLEPRMAGEPGWLNRQRQEAMEIFRQSGFPGPRDEDWRYTPLRPITGKRFEIGIESGQGLESIQPWLISGLDSHRLVFVDGVFNAGLSSPGAAESGVSMRPLSLVLRDDPDSLPATVRETIAPRDGFQALNLAFARDGYVVDITRDHEPGRVLEFVFVSAADDRAGQVRNILRLDRNARASVVERHVSLQNTGALANTATRIVLESGASLNYHLVESVSARMNMISDVEADLAADSTLKTMTVTLGGGLVRNSIRVRLNGAGGHCDMLGLYAVSGRQHVDNHTGVIHSAPHCSSRELYKGVLDQRSRGVFHGRIRVDQGAVKTDATQANNNLLLSADAEIDTKPQLEIYADDVKCAHGATVGQLDETALFYLRSRGIDVSSARSLLTFAFLNEVLSEITEDPLRLSLETELSRRFISDE
jgi:Fe-S cluster assembly protein SufD